MTPEKFWTTVEKGEKCWLWEGGRNADDYGQFSHCGRVILAHRFSWELENGPIPTGLLVCHTCDTPACVRPLHLFVGTQKDNMMDSIQKGRSYRGDQRGECNGNAKLTWGIVEEIRSNVSKGIRQIDEARRVGVSKGRMSEIINHKTWQRDGTGMIIIKKRG